MTEAGYLHGYTRGEQDRLIHQAEFLESVVFKDVDFFGRKKLLEVGCGVGAQTDILLRRFPRLHVTGVDRSASQLARARANLKPAVRARQVEFVESDATKLPFRSRTFDSAFLCWFLEHVPKPPAVLRETRRVLKPGSVLYANEVLNSSLVLIPQCPATYLYWETFNKHQRSLSGDPDAGAKLGNWLTQAGFRVVETTVKTMFLDDRDPRGRAQMLDMWISLLLSGAPELLKEGLVSRSLVREVKAELKSLAKMKGSIFLYSFIQARAVA